MKICFPVPNVLLDFDLPAGAVAVYGYLLRHANRKPNQCHSNETSIAKKLHLSRNTVVKHVRLLEEHGLIVTERTEIITKRGIKKNGNLLYTIVPMHEIRKQFYERQLHELELTVEHQRVQKKLENQTIA